MGKIYLVKILGRDWLEHLKEEHINHMPSFVWEIIYFLAQSDGPSLLRYIKKWNEIYPS